MSGSGKINPEISLATEKLQVKKQREHKEAMKNRVELLRQQLQKEKEGVKKNKQLTKETIQKKVQVNKINQWKNKDSSGEAERVNELRRRNQSLRVTHEKQLQDIQKAIYLVKLDDARQLKQQSNQHNRRLKEMDRQYLSGQQQKKRKVAEESHAAKERYMQFWKQKLAGIYTEQAQTVIKIGKQKEDNKKQLSKLEEQEIRLMEEINQYHSQGVESKKEYLAALSLPVKDVAEAMGGNSQNMSQVSRSQRQSMTINSSRIPQHQYQSKRYRKVQIPSGKMPSTNLNENKLKVILQQLKKVDRDPLHTSR